MVPRPGCSKRRRSVSLHPAHEGSHQRPVARVQAVNVGPVEHLCGQPLRERVQLPVCIHDHQVEAVALAAAGLGESREIGARNQIALDAQSSADARPALLERIRRRDPGGLQRRQHGGELSQRTVHDRSGAGDAVAVVRVARARRDHTVQLRPVDTARDALLVQIGEAVGPVRRRPCRLEQGQQVLDPVVGGQRPPHQLREQQSVLAEGFEDAFLGHRVRQHDLHDRARRRWGRLVNEAASAAAALSGCTASATSSRPGRSREPGRPRPSRR